MLKVLHTGDWHIGSFPGPEVGGQNARFQDICRCLDFQAMYAEEHRPEISEWGNPPEQTSGILTPIHNVRRGTR